MFVNDAWPGGGARRHHVASTATRVHVSWLWRFIVSPLLILAIGIATVLGLILFLRVNAFLALIISAIVVSLLAPGDVGEKISRVADAFGSAAGNIAIVIALAAIIGECMMASGAADRIVQAFLRLLGEKRAPTALMGSGFVLAVPVFFDTVFYLLVPLARSLYRKTGKNYLLYILAIAAGGAITHTLVPPTPGPLVMASNLGIDVGVMILVGAMVALPAAVAGLITARVLDKRLDIPFRETEGQDSPTVLESNLPSLWLSLLPVVLPVALISANTALSTMANNERPAQLSTEDIHDWDGFQAAIRDAGEEPSPAARVAMLLPADLVERLQQDGSLTDEEQQQVVAALGNLLVQKSPLLYEAESFDDVIVEGWKIDRMIATATLTDDQMVRAQRRKALIGWVSGDLSGKQPHELERINRALLEVSFPELIALHTWETPLRRAAEVSSLFGNANLALLLSTIVAMGLLFRQQQMTLAELSQTVERSLMSGGTIILITAAGGAFGAMLKTAQIGDAIKDSFAGTGASSGLMFLLLGYGVAALMKVAQGSSTVAMITVSGMLAAMLTGGDVLGFHRVYLATAIGAGSLMGSWMNDSGFWIFTKMGRLTEAESLNSWTILLVILSLVSLGVTVLLSQVLPLA